MALNSYTRVKIRSYVNLCPTILAQILQPGKKILYTLHVKQQYETKGLISLGNITEMTDI